MTSQITDLTPKYCFLDVEVDSVPRDDGEPRQCITQISVLDPSREKEQRIFNAYIKPPEELRRKEIERKYQQGYIEPPRYAFEEVWPDLVKWVNTGLDGNRNVVVIMHNGIAHDWPILEREVARGMMRTINAIPGIPRHWKPLDTVFLKNALHIQGDGSLTGLCHTLGARVREAHNAIEDVKMTKAIFKKMVGTAPLKDVLTAATLRPAEHPYLKIASLINRVAVANLAVFDFETTGLFPAQGQPGPKPRAVQLAAYIPAVNKLFNEKINPGVPIPRGASAVHHLYDDDVKDAPDFKAVWGRFQQFLSTNNAKALAGHNIWFYDLKVADAECERTGMKKERFKSIDSLALARNLFKGIKGIPQRGFFKLEYMAPLLGINVIDAHDAKGDVMVNWQLIQKFTEGVDSAKILLAIQSGHPAMTLGQLCRDAEVFSGEHYWKLYQTACGLTMDLARYYFPDIQNEEYFKPANFGCILGIAIKKDDPEMYNLWRIFLKLTEGVDRAVINQALSSIKPFDAIAKLCHQKKTFDAKHCTEFNNKVYELTPALVHALFPGQKLDPARLAAKLGLILGDAFTPFDMKRLFLELTHGVDQITIERVKQQSLLPEQALADLIKQKGSFDPARFEEAQETRGLKRIFEEEKAPAEKKQPTILELLTQEEPKRKRLKKLSEVITITPPVEEKKTEVETKAKPSKEKIIRMKDHKLTLIFDSSSDEEEEKEKKMV